MEWYHEPANWQDENGVLTVTTALESDYWRVTRHNFIKDDGYFYFERVSGDFTATVRFSGDYRLLYDQAGLMVRENERVWIKCGVEYVDGQQYASAVITRDFSDWSIVRLAGNPSHLWIRVERTGSAIEVSYAYDGQTYTMIRQGYLSEAETLEVGMMCASPSAAEGESSGFTARFEDFQITRPD